MLTRRVAKVCSPMGCKMQLDLGIGVAPRQACPSMRSAQAGGRRLTRAGVPLALEPIVTISGAPGVIRTRDTRFRKPLLYPLSYGGDDPRLVAAGQSSAREMAPVGQSRTAVSSSGRRLSSGCSSRT